MSSFVSGNLNLLKDAYKIAGPGAVRLLWKYAALNKMLNANRSRLLTGAEYDELVGQVERLNALSEPVLAFDIIVPVHNAYDDFSRVLTTLSTLPWNDIGSVNLVDDLSDDESCRTAIRKFCDTHPKARSLFREKRGGFAKAVNTAIKTTTNDVVVINTDTVFKPDIPSLLMGHLRSQHNIAMAVPMTDNGFLASLPQRTLPAGNFWRENCDEVDTKARNLFAGINQPISIPPASFIAIKRRYLDQHGGFVEDGIGYGEDTQMGLESLRKDWQNVIALDTFVSHLGGASYKYEKRNLVRRASLRILYKYPEISRVIEQDLKKSSLPFYHLQLLTDIPSLELRILNKKALNRAQFFNNKDNLVAGFDVDSELAEKLKNNTLNILG